MGTLATGDGIWVVLGRISCLFVRSLEFWPVLDTTVMYALRTVCRMSYATDIRETNVRGRVIRHKPLMTMSSTFYDGVPQGGRDRNIGLSDDSLGLNVFSEGAEDMSALAYRTPGAI
jgi:hypothetical protein